jgi:hypothetical protein
MRFYVLVCLLITQGLWVSAQLIVKKQGYFGIINEQTGDLLLPTTYDTIYALPFDLHVTNSSTFLSNSPLFACQTDDSIKIYNSFTGSFYPGAFNEVRFTEELEDQWHPFPEQYQPNHIDCIMLRKGAYWGYIGHTKSYGFHDDLKKDDEFIIVKPQYNYLRFVQEQAYSNHEYKRTQRIVVALKDSLYGALSFQTGEVVVPFEFVYPIERYANAYNRRGLEFLSMEGGFIPFYIARQHYDAKEQLIINAQGKSTSFYVDYPYTMQIYHEQNEDYLYVFSKDLTENTLTIWNYNSGAHVLRYQCKPGYIISNTKRFEDVLMIQSYDLDIQRHSVVWINLISKEVLLAHEDKLKRLVRHTFGVETLSDERWVSYKKPSNHIGKLVGSGANLEIEWIKKPYLNLKDYTKH